MLKTYYKFNYLFFLLISLIIGQLALADVKTERLDELKTEIAERNLKIKELERQINIYQQNVTNTSQQASSLKNEITKLDTVIKKINTDINLTENKIATAKLTLEKLSLEISDKNNHLGVSRDALAESLREMRQGEILSLTEVFLSKYTLSDLLTQYDRHNNLQIKVRDQIANLENVKDRLKQQQEEVETERQKLIGLTKQLGDQKSIVADQQGTKSAFLRETQNEEAAYRKLLTEYQTRRTIFEQEIFEFESQLKAIIDPKSLPSAGRGVLSWPIDMSKCHLYKDLGNSQCLTQKFGYTSAASKLYSSNFHNGIDFRASVGTPIKSTASGNIVGVGDTDIACRGASYGKWIMIDHGNGLASVFAHLSLIGVREGQVVNRGDVIGYSGNSGYSTGPHLHLGLVASTATTIGNLPSKACPGAIFRIPLIPIEAYLDPLSYL